MSCVKEEVKVVKGNAMKGLGGIFLSTKEREVLYRRRQMLVECKHLNTSIFTRVTKVTSNML